MDDIFTFFLNQFTIVYRKYMEFTNESKPEKSTLKERFVALRTISSNRYVQLEFDFVKPIDDAYVAARYNIYKDKNGNWREI